MLPDASSRSTRTRRLNVQLSPAFRFCGGSSESAASPTSAYIDACKLAAVEQLRLGWGVGEGVLLPCGADSTALSGGSNPRCPVASGSKANCAARRTTLLLFGWSPP